MSGLLYGFKAFGFLTDSATDTPLSQKYAWFPEHTQAVVEVTGNEETINAYINGSSTGKIQPFKVFEDADTFAFTITVAGFSWTNLQLLAGEFAEATSSYERRVAKRATVPSSSPYTITDSDLAGAAVADVQVSKAELGSWGSPGGMTVQTTSVTSGSTTQVQITGSTLVFSAAMAGAPIDYFVTQTRTNIPSIGQETTYDAIQYVGFHGLIGVDEYGSDEGIEIVIPKMKRNRGFSLDSSSRTYEIGFTPVLKAGERSVVKFFEVTADSVPSPSPSP